MKELTSFDSAMIIMVRAHPSFDFRFLIQAPIDKKYLREFRHAKKAQHQGGDICHSGTCNSVLEEIKLWAMDFDKPAVFGLSGLPGTGKSTIARTVAESLSRDGLLGASFFCSRNDQDLSNLKAIFPTLAVQLADSFPNRFIERGSSGGADPFSINFEHQIDELIVGPLKDSGICGTVIVIDALDECKDEGLCSNLFSALNMSISKIREIKLKFFITGRPEPQIREGFRSLEGRHTMLSLQTVGSRQDINLFFKNSLSNLISGEDRIGGWLAEGGLDQLCDRAGELFFYAKAMVKFISHESGDPGPRLEALLKLSERKILEIPLTEGTTIASLYTSALPADLPVEIHSSIRSVLGAVVLAQSPISPYTIGMLLDLEYPRCYLRLLCSLMILPGDENGHIQTLHHKSLTTFFTNKELCTNEQFYISPPTHHKELLIGCLKQMNKNLKEDMFKSQDVATSSASHKQYINGPLEYACRSWYHHLAGTMSTDVPGVSEIEGHLCTFLQKMSLWAEVLGVLGAANDAEEGWKILKKWAKEVSQVLHP